MNRISIALCAAAALGLGACQQAAELDNVAVNEAVDTTNYVAEVLALEEGQRLGVFFRAIRDAGLPCQQVVSAEIEPTMNPITWRATCEDGADHLISLTEDGTANILSGRR